MLKKIKKSEKGSITILVLTTMLVVVGVILFAYFSIMNKSSSQERELDKIQEEYNKTDDMMSQAYNENVDDEYFEKTATIDGEDIGTELNPTIPEGFKPIDTDTSEWGDGTKPPEEDDVNNGLVIQDRNENQFVWIPVATPVSDTEANGTTNKAMAVKIGDNYRGLIYEFSASGSNVMSGCTTTKGNYREPDIVSDYDNDKTNNNGLFTKNSLQEEYNKMIESVTKYHGFYIGRYELGLEGNIPVSKNASTNSGVVTADSSNSNTKMWYGLYSKCKEFAREESDKSVVSTMLWGSQYDAMMNWMMEHEIDIVSLNNTIYNNSKQTGSKEKDLLKNIYDIYGCHKEWTLEVFTLNSRVFRGGFYNGCNIISERFGYYPEHSYDEYSTRLALYIKDN